eukprot:GGOE01024634.1.p1 GENE.GGOE01024634.1~~GGOE01024634.1.p1  ORF type:complete len:1092 (+),score=202.55 GGOE01024634.1:64-3339(+)
MHMATSNVQVSVRVRPECLRETEDPRHRCVLQVCDNMVFVSAKVNAAGAPGIVQRYQDKHFAFDRVYADNAATKEVFEGSVKDFVPGLLKGFSLTVFAYGATGSGKTYTMMGTDRSQAGINILTMSHLFHLIEVNKELDVQVSVSYLEIYNETIRDLLVPDSRTLNLREDPAQGAVVSGLTWCVVGNAESVIKLMEEGRERRVQASTLANEVSSRSHAVLQVQIKTQEKEPDIHAQVREARLSLVDLAGSERAAMCENEGVRLKEGANINRSLLALGNCINALAAKKKAQHIPYRDSKLTRMLKNCLGGSCQAVMIANVSPSSMFYEDTDNTLRYANRAKNIKVSATSRVTTVTRHVSEYRRVIVALQKEVEELRSKLQEAIPRDRLSENKAKTERQEGDGATPAVVEELANVMHREIVLRKEIVTLHKKKQENVVAMQRQFLTLFRWKHGLSRPLGPGEEEPASIVHARTVADLCGKAEEQLSAQLAALQQQVGTTAEQYRFLVNRIPELPLAHRTLLEIKVQLHERHVKYYELMLQCAESRAAQQLQAQANEEAQMALSETQHHVENLFTTLVDCGAMSEELQARHEKARAWLSLPTINLREELAGDQGDTIDHPLARVLLYMNTLQHPTRRLSALSISSSVRGRSVPGVGLTSPTPLSPAQVLAAQRHRHNAKGLGAPHQRPSSATTTSKALAGSLDAETPGRPKPSTLNMKQQAERNRRRLHQLQNTPMLTGICDEPNHTSAPSRDQTIVSAHPRSSSSRPPTPAGTSGCSAVTRSTSTWAVPSALPKAQRNGSVASSRKRKRDNDDTPGGLTSPTRHWSCPVPPTEMAARSLPFRARSLSEPSTAGLATPTDGDSTSAAEGRTEPQRLASRKEERKVVGVTPGRKRWVRRPSSRGRLFSRLESNEFDGAELPKRCALAEGPAKPSSPVGRSGPCASDTERMGNPSARRLILRPIKTLAGEPKGPTRRTPLRQRCPNVIQKRLLCPSLGKRGKPLAVLEIAPQYMQATLSSGQKSRQTSNPDSPLKSSPLTTLNDKQGEPVPVVRRISRRKLQAARDLWRLQRQATAGQHHSSPPLPFLSSIPSLEV